MLDMVNRSHASVDGKNTPKPWKWMLIDSAIIGGIAAFAAIGGGGPTWDTLWVIIKAFGLAFCVQLAVERGLKRPAAEQK